MMYASLSGRLGKDPQKIQTKPGKSMTTASVAVDVSAPDQDATAWIKVVAFGRLADLLSWHQKGDAIAVTGRLELYKWEGGEGWQMYADALHSPRTVRAPRKDGRAGAPKGGKSETADVRA